MIARMLKSTCLLVGVFGFGPFGLSESQDTVTAPVDKVLVPTGLTSRHSVELTLTGVFPNSCHIVSDAKAEVDLESKVIKITARSMVRQNEDVMCAQVMTRFIHPVIVGPLHVGVYTINVLGRPFADAEPLTIEASGDEVSTDVTYAPIEEADLVRTSSGDPQIEIAGNFPFTLTGCMVLRDAAAALEPGNVVVVEPLAAYIEGERCEDQIETKAFRSLIPIGEPLKPGAYLLQIKIFGGETIRSVATID